MIELNRIYNEDCLEGMKRIPDGSIDAVICDLPYGTTANKWDTVIPFEPLWVQYKRVIKPNGAIVLFSQSPFDKVLGYSNIEMLKYEWIWVKENSTGFLNAHHAPLKLHENILVFSKCAASPIKDVSKVIEYHPQMSQSYPYVRNRNKKQSKNYGKYDGHETVSNGERFPVSVLKFSRDKIKIHPTQKPVDLIRYLVRTYTNEGDTVLDNCMGSGTTAIACIREHRSFIGFETDKEYFEKSLKRIEDEQRQTRLF